MPGFWYPYDSFQDARARVCAFADKAVGASCGVSFSDGARLSVLRHPAAAPNGARTWLNVLVQPISAPAPVPARSGGLLGSLKGWFWKAMEIEGQAEVANAQAQMAASQAVGRELRDRVWEPTHEFLIRHKFAADTAGVALDTVGVIAGGIFLIFAAPELIAAGTVAASAGLITGVAASLGSFFLFGVDGFIYGADLTGHKARAAKLEDNRMIQWARIAATVMLLPDLLVGGTRALMEIGKLANEAQEARLAAVEADGAAVEARARAAKIRNPWRHPAPLNRRLHKAKLLEQRTQALLHAADAATGRIGVVATRDIGLFQGATVAGTGLLTAAPPGVVLSPVQKKRDEDYERSLAPKGGLPRDVRLELRVMSFLAAGAFR